MTFGEYLREGLGDAARNWLQHMFSSVKPERLYDQEQMRRYFRKHLAVEGRRRLELIERLDDFFDTLQSRVSGSRDKAEAIRHAANQVAFEVRHVARIVSNSSEVDPRVQEWYVLPILTKLNRLTKSTISGMAKSFSRNDVVGFFNRVKEVLKEPVMRTGVPLIYYVAPSEDPAHLQFPKPGQEPGRLGVYDPDADQGVIPYQQMRKARVNRGEDMGPPKEEPAAEPEMRPPLRIHGEKPNILPFRRKKR